MSQTRFILLILLLLNISIPLVLLVKTSYEVQATLEKIAVQKETRCRKTSTSKRDLIARGTHDDALFGTLHDEYAGTTWILRSQDSQKAEGHIFTF